MRKSSVGDTRGTHHVTQRAANEPPCRVYRQADACPIANKEDAPLILEARQLPASGARNVTVIETATPPKKRVKTAKVYPPHEHFGSPTNVCRTCGETYAYVPKPYATFFSDKKT